MKEKLTNAIFTKKQAIVYSTNDYEKFELHYFNRDVEHRPMLIRSLKEEGFAPSSPIHCINNGNGKLKIIRGHHRFEHAQRLGVPVSYVIDNDHKDILKLEEDGGQTWRLRHWVVARDKSGDKECKQLLKFADRHRIEIGTAASLLGGEAFESHNRARDIRHGRFTITQEKHAELVMSIVNACRLAQVEFTKTSGFIKAISIALKVDGFNPEVFLSRVRSYPTKMRSCTKSLDYLTEIEKLYNYHTETKDRLSIAFPAKRLYEAYLAERKNTKK